MCVRAYVRVCVCAGACTQSYFEKSQDVLFALLGSRKCQPYFLRIRPCGRAAGPGEYSGLEDRSAVPRGLLSNPGSRVVSDVLPDSMLTEAISGSVNTKEFVFGAGGGEGGR